MAKVNKVRKTIKKKPKVEERIHLDMSFEDAMKLAVNTPAPKKK